MNDTSEKPQGCPRVTAQQLIELQRQKEIIEQWLLTPGVPTDAHAKLLEMLGEVNTEMQTNGIVSSPEGAEHVHRLVL